MAISRIKGQEKALQLLEAAFEAGRLSHAYLFHGPDGVGKEATALEFAQALNCAEDGLAACGECSACRMSERLSHPDIHLIFPVPRTIKPAEMSEILARYANVGYRESDFGRKTAIISVETVLAEIVAKANQRPYLGPWKAFIVADADLMTSEAANTLLKTLEEPPEQTVIILTSSRPNALPATVVSRCQRIPFSLLSRQLIEEVLLGDPRLGFDSESARSAASLAQGSVGRAVRVEREGSGVDLDRVASIMKGDRTKNVQALMNEASGLAFRLGREEQQRVLELMLLWYRDILRLSQMGGAEAGGRVLYADHLQELKRQAAAMDVSSVTRLVTKLEEARRAIERYSNATIVFTSVLLDTAMARKSATGGRGESRAT